MKIIYKFQKVYKKFPTVKELKLLIKDLNILERLETILNIDTKEYENEFLLKEIEENFRVKLIFNEFANGVEQLKEGEIDKISIVADEIKKITSFTFDTKIGLNLFSKDGIDRIYDHIHSNNIVVPTGVKEFDNKIQGGFHKKSVSIILAEGGKGKTLILCAFSANMILQNYKVLYITLELSEEYIGERIIQNIFNIEQTNLKNLSKESLVNKFEKVKTGVGDKLIIKKYAAGVLNTNMLKSLVGELQGKLKFEPDIIMIDYLGLFAALGVGKDAGSNEKGIAKCQELEAFADEYNIPVVVPAQSNRSGYGSSSLNPKNIADAIGIFTETDLVVGITQTEEQRELSTPVYSWSIMKNRFGLNMQGLNVGVNYDKMRLINLDSDELIKENDRIDMEKIKNIISDTDFKQEDKMKNIIKF